MTRIWAALRRNPIVFPLALIAAVGMVFISEGAYWRSVRSLDALGGVTSARWNIQGLERGLVDAQSAQRGYLLTGHGAYLETYARALLRIDESLRALDRYYAPGGESERDALSASGDDAGHRRDLAAVHALAETQLTELALTIRLMQQGQRQASMAIVESDIGRQKMVAIRALTARLLEQESLNVAEGRRNVYSNLMLSRVGIAALSAVSLLSLAFYLRQASALRAQQLEIKRRVQAERDRLEIEVRQRTAELTELTQHLQTAREDERNRLARNLHDELGALLTSAKLDAARIRSRLAGTAPEALERLAHLVDTLNSSIALGRRIIEDLRPSTLANLGLVATLEILAREFAATTGLELHCALSAVRLDASAELVVYRLVQEAITNIGKYAQASQVWLTLAAQDGRVRVSVRDDGIGFDTHAKPNSAYGLLGMRFRVEAAGGALSLASEPGQGTLIQVTLPESQPARPEDPPPTIAS